MTHQATCWGPEILVDLGWGGAGLGGGSWCPSPLCSPVSQGRELTQGPWPSRGTGRADATIICFVYKRRGAVGEAARSLARAFSGLAWFLSS